MGWFRIAWLFVSQNARWFLMGAGAILALVVFLSIKGCEKKEECDAKCQLAISQSALSIATETAAKERQLRIAAEARAAALEQDFSKFRIDAAKNRQAIAAIPSIKDETEAFAKVNAHLARMFHEAENLFTGS